MRFAPRERAAIVIPAYNEEATIGAVVKECEVTRLPVFVVDDGSDDRTTQRARKAGAIALRQTKNGGVGSALGTGIRAAVESGFEIVITMDGDGAHDASFVTKLLERLHASKADLVLGSRFRNRHWAADIPSTKHAANYFAARILNNLTAQNFTDVTTGMRALGPKALDLPLSCTDFGFIYEMTTSALQQGLGIAEEPIRVRYNATDLLCTSRRELLDFMTFAVSFGGANTSSKSGLERVKAEIESFDTVFVRVGTRNLVLIPIREHDAYSFQFQADWFVTRLEAPWIVLS